MVKIRLRRVGTKARPFYRMVVAPSAAGRNGKFVEIIGTYDPVSQPKIINVKEDRALHWLLQGAVPSETTAVLLSKLGVLEKFFAERPSAKKQYSFLDKRTAAISVKSAIEAPAVEKAKPISEAPVATAEETVEAAEETVATAEDAVETPADEQPVAEESPAAGADEEKGE